MPDRLSLSRSFGWFVCLGLLAAPAFAHKIEVSGDVAGTWHVEPNHNPKAGEPARVWVALTRQGGQILPLNQCDCKLAIYPEPHTQGSSPLLEPALKAISAEQYQGIPGAEVIFPKIGIYKLELSGTPVNGANFQPFQINYTVTVASGERATRENSQIQTNPDKLADNHRAEGVSQPVQIWGSLIVAGAIAFGGIMLIRRRFQK